MQKSLLIITLCVLSVSSGCFSSDRFNTDAPDPDFSDLKLTYDQPAKFWTEALAVGNGRLGAMVFGGVETERIQFNEDTLWTGRPRGYEHPGAYGYLGQIRQMLFDGKQKEAEALAMERFMSVPLHQKAYQPFGDISIAFANHNNPTRYQRQLDLDTAIATTTYEVDGVTYSREVFSSKNEQVLVVRLSASSENSISCNVTLKTPHKNASVMPQNGKYLVLKGDMSADNEDNVLKYQAVLCPLVNNGTMNITEKGIEITNADSVTMFLAAATSYVNFEDVSADPAGRCRATMSKVEGKKYEAVKSEHIASYRELFRRVAIDLGKSKTGDQPTDDRIENFSQSDDPQLVSLFFQFGRYLLISSSLDGSQPANLQGIWNEKLSPPWDSKYTTNINAEMNYWPAEVTNLSECHEPLFDMIDDLVITGAKVAKEHYNCRGWVLHHNTDLWRGAAPINKSNHGIWPTGGAWLCQHLYQHYDFTQDKQFLAERAYPVMKQAAMFFVDFLIEDPRTGVLISTPSNSPENGGLVAGPTMDHQIISELFQNCIEASEILNTDAEFRKILEDKLARIAPMQIGKYGQLQEWLEDVDNPKNQHRHVSHLWGLYPGRQITQSTPELLNAAKKSLEFRGDSGKGWSMAWKINLWARFLDGNHAYSLIKNQLNLVDSAKQDKNTGGTYANMFDAHPPFQIDGNFGATAGIAEMLLQSHEGYMRLLPALPDAWSSGHVRGLVGRGGFQVDMQWENGTLKTASITSVKDNVCRIETGVSVEVTCNGRAVKTVSNADNTISFDTGKSKTYKLTRL